jgi:hypothetical protein
MAKLKTYICYDYDNDSHYKDSLSKWKYDAEIDFSFYEMTRNVSVESDDAEEIKRIILERIGEATYFLCLIGRQTYTNDWVAWEIEKAVELGKRLVIVQILPEYSPPDAILNVGASWATFTLDSIHNAMGMTKNRHGCLTIWLFLLAIANAAVFFLFLIFGRVAMERQFPDAAGWEHPVLTILCLFNVVFAIAIAKWKKWGFWGLCLSSIIATLINFSLGVEINSLIGGLVGVILLFGLLHIGGKNKGWLQLE